MKSFLQKIRYEENKIPLLKQIVHTIGILFLGILLGTFSKYLDYRQAELPYLLGIIDERLDLHNFLGTFAPWILLAVLISVYSKTAMRASVNVFVFFGGMVSSYYLYSKFMAGFFPKSYAMIWVCFTLVSPLLAFICWYAKGTGRIAFMISGGILGVLFNSAFAYGMTYFSIRSILELFTFLAAILVLHRKKGENLIMMGLGVLIGFLIKIISPFHFW